HDRAQLAALADVVVEAGKRGPVEPDRRIRTVEPAEQAVDAALELDVRLHAGAPAAGARAGRVLGPERAAEWELSPGQRARHPYPSSTARRISSGGAFFPSSSSAAVTTGSSGAASAPASTRFAYRGFGASLAAGTQRTSNPARSSGTVSAFSSTKPSGARPSVTSTSWRSDGSSTTATSGRVTASWRRIGSSSLRVYARNGAPRRSGPYSGKAWTYRPASSSAVA